jgi:hypothetical protein
MRAFGVLGRIMVAAVLGILAAGCDTVAAQPARVRGKISYKGEPLPSGMIVFTPDASRGGSGPLACADVQPDGTYELRSEEGPGVPPGWYRVAVVAVEASAPTTEGQGFTIPKSLLPEKYRDPEVSGLSCEVKAARENTINFNLD